MVQLMPVNFSVEDAHAAAGITNADLPEVPQVAELDNWAQEAYSLDVSAATNLGFPVGNLSATFRRQALMFGSSRWRDVAKGGHSYRFGVSLRAVIVVSDVKGDGALTLPVVAAKVELEGAKATAQLLVRGYKGRCLADELPPWQTFGVDSYAQYMKAVSDIQKQIMEDEANITPELLATTVISSDSTALPPPQVSVGCVYALHGIAEGATLAHTIDKLRTHDPDVLAALRAMYRANIGDEEQATPNSDQQELAQKQLYELHVRDGFFR